MRSTGLLLNTDAQIILKLFLVPALHGKFFGRVCYLGNGALICKDLRSANASADGRVKSAQRRSVPMVMGARKQGDQNFRPVGDSLLRAIFEKYINIPNFGLMVSKAKVRHVLILTKYGLGCILGDFFTTPSGHPARKQ
jgi:hypothetical protein